MKHLAPMALAAALCPHALASDFDTPSGIQLESVPGAPVAAQLADGTLLYATGSFGADELSIRLPDGTFQLFADGFGSLSGVAQSPVTGRIVVGDSFPAGALRLLEDLNADGDALDAGENVPHPVQPPVLPGGAVPLPFDIAFRPGTDEFWFTGSTPFGFEPFAGVLVRVADGRAEVLLDDLGFAAGLVFDGDTLYVADLAADFSSGRVLSLDSTAAPLAPTEFAGGLSGASDLARGADGHLYLSGTTDTLSGDFSGCVTRLAPDLDDDGLTDGVEPCFLDGFEFSGGLVLAEGPGGFMPGASGEGALYVGDFTYAGARRFATAPLAATAVDGPITQNSVALVTVSGAPGALGFFAVSLDVGNTTIAGIGDLCLGFAAPSLISGLKPLGGSGEATFKLVFRELPSAVDMPIAFQGFTLEDGRFGIGNGLDFIFGT